MHLRFLLDPVTGEPHLLEHGVTCQDVQDVLERPIDDARGREGARIAVGQNRGGRYIRVIYLPDDEPGSAFVITAYPVGPRMLKAVRRRLKRKS